MSLPPASSGTSASHVLIVDDDLFMWDVMAMILDLQRKDQRPDRPKTGGKHGVPVVVFLV
jgi:hypothetical protein